MFGRMNGRLQMGEEESRGEIKSSQIVLEGNNPGGWNKTKLTPGMDLDTSGLRKPNVR